MNTDSRPPPAETVDAVQASITLHPAVSPTGLDARFSLETARFRAFLRLEELDGQ